MKEEVIQAFNKLSVCYEHEDNTNNAYNIEYERPAMVGLLPDHLDNLKVLDAGCAAGWYTEYLLRQGAIPTAIDISPEMVDAAKRRTAGKVEVLCRDLSDPLPFADDSFDLIISSLTLHYLQDWHHIFSEFARVLHTNGILLYSVHHPMMDITFSQTQRYFETELLTDEWEKGEVKVNVPFYRRPLQDIVNLTSHYFNLDKLVEPTPTEVFRKNHAESYKRLMQRPNFLIIRAVNK